MAKCNFEQVSQRQTKSPLGRFAVAILLLCSWCVDPAFSQDRGQFDGEPADYRLGPFDQLRVKIVALRASQAEVLEWNAINGEYTVGFGGRVSLPLIGEVQASDSTTRELAKILAQRLQTRLNIAQTLDATVEITKFRPFYIVGDVANSGEYSYRPGMTVIQALSIAGGLPRSHSIDVRQVDREIAAWTGELNQLSDEQTMLRSQIEQQEKLLALVQQDKQQVESKQRTGLVTEQRYMSTQRDLATAQSDLLRSKIRLQEIRHKMATNKVLIAGSDRIAPTWAAANLNLSIVRLSGSAFTEISANETTLVAPGDTIKVRCCDGEGRAPQSFVLKDSPRNP